MHFGQCGSQEWIFKAGNRELQPHCKSEDKRGSNWATGRKPSEASGRCKDRKREERHSWHGTFQQGNKQFFLKKYGMWRSWIQKITAFLFTYGFSYQTLTLHSHYRTMIMHLNKEIFSFHCCKIAFKSKILKNFETKTNFLEKVK